MALTFGFRNRRCVAAIVAATLTAFFFLLLLRLQHRQGEHHDDNHAPGQEIPHHGMRDESFSAIQTWFKMKYRLGSTGTKEQVPEKAEGDADPPDPLPKFWSVHKSTSTGSRNTAKPPGVDQVMALVFYSRRSTAAILDCYLKRNLIKRGGMLTGVTWVQHTTNPLDLVFLEKLLHSEPTYRRVYADGLSLAQGTGRATGFGHIDNDVMYIRMEDDIAGLQVFMEDTVIPTLVHTRASDGNFSHVSANMVGSSYAALDRIHWSLDVVRPYLPELVNDFPIITGRRIDWRASSLPPWTGPRDFDVTSWASPDDLPHRWLPVPAEEDSQLTKQRLPLSHGNTTQTNSQPQNKHQRNAVLDPPISPSSESTLSSPLSWHMAAQAHYSLLEALEAKDLDRYRFDLLDLPESSSDPMSTTTPHLVAMTGRDINDAKMKSGSDRRRTTVLFPHDTDTDTGRRAIAAGEAVAAQYSARGYGGRHRVKDGGLDSTDLLDRYRAFARENICAGGELLWSSVGDDPAGTWAG